MQRINSLNNSTQRGILFIKKQFVFLSVTDVQVNYKVNPTKSPTSPQIPATIPQNGNIQNISFIDKK